MGQNTEQETFMTISGLKKEEIEGRKNSLIKRYLELQDTIDNYNEEVYNVCCEIEAINIALKTLEKAEKHGGNGHKTSKTG